MHHPAAAAAMYQPFFMGGPQSAFLSKFSLINMTYLNVSAESYLQSLAAMNGLAAAAAEQQSIQSPSSPNVTRPSNPATPNSANEETSATDKPLTDDSTVRNNGNVNAMFASAMQQFLQQQQYFNTANAWFGSQFLQKQLASPAGAAANAFVFPPAGLFMPNTGDPISNESTPTTNGSNGNLLSAFLAANPMKVDKSKTESAEKERPDSKTPTEESSQ
jgi:hypothetical protein